MPTANERSIQLNNEIMILTNAQKLINYLPTDTKLHEVNLIKGSNVCICYP